MYLWRTKFREKKSVVKEFGDMFAPSIWIPIHMVRKPMTSLDEGYLFVMNLYVEGMQPTPFSPWDQVVVTEQELQEYFEELPDEVKPNEEESQNGDEVIWPLEKMRQLLDESVTSKFASQDICDAYCKGIQHCIALLEMEYDLRCLVEK